MSNEIVVKSNHLVEASYKISLNEQRLILCAISRIDKDNSFPNKIAITAKQFLSLFPDVGREHAHKELKKAANKLWDRTIKVVDPEQTKEFRWIQTKIIPRFGEGRIILEFSNEIKKYLYQLHSFFTSYKLKEISALKSAYSIRLYELIKQFEALQTRKISLAKFREFFQLGDKYKEFKHLKARVITPAIKELNKKAPLVIGVDFERHLRKIAYLQFNWQEKPR